MIDRIVGMARSCTYDFRVTASDEDPLLDRFDEWVPYYRTKWAIAKILQPRLIAEVGVRFGYSALAFMDASAASYIGFDNDSETFGGSRSAYLHASKQLGAQCLPERAQIVLGDVLAPTFRFPFDADLIHLDGPQDRTAWTQLLDLAAANRGYILVDGYYFTDETFAAVNDWLRSHRELVAWWAVIPNEYGDLLMEMN